MKAERNPDNQNDLREDFPTMEPHGRDMWVWGEKAEQKKTFKEQLRSGPPAEKTDESFPTRS